MKEQPWSNKFSSGFFWLKPWQWRCVKQAANKKKSVMIVLESSVLQGRYPLIHPS